MKIIESAIAEWYENGQGDITPVYEVVKAEMDKNAAVIVPVRMGEDIEAQYLNDANDKKWLPIFTDIKEVQNGLEQMLASCPIRELVEMAARDEDCKGIVINAWGKRAQLDRESCERMLMYN